MRARVLRLLLFTSSPKSSSLSPQASILRNSPSTTSFLKNLLSFHLENGYSSSPRRPMRGREKRDDQSEDFFLRNLNFGNEKVERFGDGGDEKLEQTHEGFPGSRSMKGERRVFDEKEDFFSKESRTSEISKRPVTRDRRESGNLRQSFNLGSREEMNEGSGDFSTQSFEPGDGSQSPVKEQGGDQSQTDFIHKLKFRDDGVKEEKPKHESVVSAQVSEEESILTETSPQDADEIFKKMKETGLIPNAVSMLDGLCKDGLIQEAMKLFGSMRETGTIPEVVIYTAVVEGFCKAGKYDDAKRIFRKMQNNGVVPNAFSYGVILQGLCKGKKLEDCVEYCMEMLDAGHAPNVVTFTGMVDAICKEKGVEGAERAIRTLRERGFALDEKAVRDYLDKKGPFSPLVQEAIFGKRGVTRTF